MTAGRNVQQEDWAAWRLFVFNWIPLGCFSGLLTVGLGLTGPLVIGTELLQAAIVVLGAATVLLLLVARRVGHTAVFVAGTATQLLLITSIAGPLTYVAATANMPLQDSALATFDRALGLDWRVYLDFVHARPSLIVLFTMGYDMIFWPMFAIPLLLGLKAQHDRLNRYTLALLLTFAMTIVVSIAVPAFGPYQPLAHSDYALIHPTAYFDHAREFPRIRDGSLDVIDFRRLAGIVTFPSFHAASAVLYMWVFWPIWWMRPAVVIGCGTMLLATPICGGHYFIDIVAGVGVAVLAIAMAGAAARRLAAQQLAPPMMVLQSPA